MENTQLAAFNRQVKTVTRSLKKEIAELQKMLSLKQSQLNSLQYSVVHRNGNGRLNWSKILIDLPNPFTTTDLYQATNKSMQYVYSMLWSWSRSGKIQKTAQGYTKAVNSQSQRQGGISIVSGRPLRPVKRTHAGA